MKRIDRLAARIAALTVKQDAEQNWPRFILHLSDGSTAELVAQLPAALVRLTELHIMPEREVLSIEKPEQLDSLTEQLYELFEYIVMGGVSVSDARTALLYADDSYLLPPEEPTEDEAISERNHNLI
ncbi:hypothetical protein WF834_13315 [Faecalibacterium sp. HTF-128]|uniref:Uncharacterized protein n=1 Tax=Faecalibacterium wellingii TaxID=2929491 RepID=A0AB35Y6T3_9FIRM